MNEYDDNLDYDKIDFDKTKRGKSKNKNSKRRISLLIIEGLIVVVVVIAGAQFLFRDDAEVENLQATIDSQNIEATTASVNQQSVLSAEELYDRALTQANTGETEQAIRSLDLAIELDPTYAEAYFERGELNYSQSLYFSASQDYSQAIEFGYDNIALAYFWRGRSSFQWDDYRQAQRDFNSAVEIDPTFTNAIYWRGRSSIKIAEYEDGITDIKQAIDMEYEEPGYGYFFIATAYDDLGEYTLAITYYDRSLEETIDDCEAYACWIDYNNRATSFYRLEQYDRAVEDYTKAIQVNPDEYPLAMQNRGDAYENLGDMTAAMSDRNTMFQLIEGEVINRSLDGDSNTLRATLETVSAQAHVTFEGTSSDVVTITVTVPEDSDLNSMMLLRGPEGVPLVYHADTESRGAQFTDLVLDETGTYTIVVASDLKDSYGEFELTIDS